MGQPQKPHRQGERGADVLGRELSVTTGLWAVLRLVSGMISAAIPNYLALSTCSTQRQMFYITQLVLTTTLQRGCSVIPTLQIRKLRD